MTPGPRPASGPGRRRPVVARRHPVALVVGLVAALLAALVVAPLGPLGATSALADTATDAPRDAADASTALTTAREQVAGVATDPDPGAPGTDLTLTLRDLWLARGDLDRAGRAAASRLLSRPTAATAPGQWRYPTGTTPERVCGVEVCVTRVTTSRHAATDAWTARTLALVETTWRRVVDDLGYRAPAGGGEAGADGEESHDGRLDVYLADLSPQGYYGFCAPEDLVPGEHARAASYCVLDNDMLGLGGRPDDALAATVAHEFFHAVQFNYDLSEDTWFMEASATWMEEVVFDGVNDNRQFLPKGQLGSPTTPLDSESGHYGNWIFVQFLAQRFGAPAVRRVWERLDASRGAPDEWSLEGVRSVLASRGAAWPAFYSDFTRANLRPGRHYREGGAYRSAPVTDRLRLGRGQRSASRAARLPHLSSRTTQVKVGALPRGRRTVRLEVRATRATYARVSVLVHRADGSVRLRRLKLNGSGRARARFPASSTKVRRLVVLTTHTAADHRRCGRNSGWACGGDPVGELAVRVTARLVR